jgi:plasmid replication initiation protein
MDKNYLVTKSNYFIMNSSYDLSLEEQKLILTLASMVQPIDEDFKPYKFKINDFMELLGVETKTKYSEIPKITKELMKKVFEIEEDDSIIQIAWLSSVAYKKGTGMVELEFSPRLKPYMLKLNGLFTQYKLANILSMKSKYSPRIYEILKCNEFKKQGFIEIEIDELRKLLKVDNIYPLYADFKRKIILQTQKELNKISDICFDFEEIKTGRKVTSLRFYINSNKSKGINKPISKDAIDEVCTTIDEDVESNIISEIKNIIKSICNRKISEKIAKEFYKIALESKKSDESVLEFIKEIANYSNTQNVENFNGWFKKMLKDYEKPIKKGKQLGFNNFKGRGSEYYGNPDLERKLLGWDN